MDIIVGGVEVKAVQLTEWAKLAAKFGDARLRGHQWEWVASGDHNSGHYLPYYAFQPLSTVTDIWEEWVSGLNGFLAVRILEEHWAAKWRRNNDFMKTEMGRRKKVVELVERLAEKPNWNVPLALRFLGETYKKFTMPRKFATSSRRPPVRASCRKRRSSSWLRIHLSHESIFTNLRYRKYLLN
jgi:hypothetical protein